MLFVFYIVSLLLLLVVLLWFSLFEGWCRNFMWTLQWQRMVTLWLLQRAKNQCESWEQSDLPPVSILQSCELVLISNILELIGNLTKFTTWVVKLIGFNFTIIKSNIHIYSKPKGAIKRLHFYFEIKDNITCVRDNKTCFEYGFGIRHASCHWLYNMWSWYEIKKRIFSSQKITT